jgi:hypothetical protein
MNILNTLLDYQLYPFNKYHKLVKKMDDSKIEQVIKEADEEIKIEKERVEQEKLSSMFLWSNTPCMKYVV